MILVVKKAGGEVYYYGEGYSTGTELITPRGIAMAVTSKEYDVIDMVPVSARKVTGRVREGRKLVEKEIEYPAYNPPTVPDDLKDYEYRYVDGVFVRGVKHSKPSRQTVITKDWFLNQFLTEVRRLLNQFAESRGYDNIETACTYANSTNAQYKAEGLRACEVRDRVWEVVGVIVQDIKTDAREVPQSIDLAIAELPVMEW